MISRVKSESDWRAQSDMETLKRAKEIEADRARLAAAKREIDREMKKLEAVKMGNRPKSRR
jgi:PHD/YefM family antitoxin component YafN of YafNO toxin-antitoxin module